MVKLFISPPLNNINRIVKYITEDQQTLQAKQNLTKLLRSNTTCHKYVYLLVWIKWSICLLKMKNLSLGLGIHQKHVLRFYQFSWTVTVPWANGKTMHTTIEDLHFPIWNDSFASNVLNGNGRLKEQIDILPKSISNRPMSILHSTVSDPSHIESFLQNIETMDYVDSKNTVTPSVGSSCKVFWPLDNHHCSVTVSTISSND